MAKKTKKRVATKPKAKKKKAIYITPPIAVGLSNFDLEKRIIAVEQRLDRIVDAISKSKKVKGL